MAATEPVLVFADDESPGADMAWLWINEQDWSGWRIQVVSALPQATDRLAGHSDRTLHPWQPPHPRPAFAEAGFTAVDQFAAVGDPREVLSQIDARVMVVGPRGRGLLKALHMGSTTEWLIHSLPAPLIIARHGRPVRRVLVCADGSPDSSAAVRTLREMPWVGSTEVTVLSVQEPDFEPGPAAEAAADILGDAPASVTVRIGTPDPLEVFFHVRDVVFAAIEALDADLVVHGSRGLSEWRSMQVGSIASSLARHAPCSTLMARADATPG